MKKYTKFIFFTIVLLLVTNITVLSQEVMNSHELSVRELERIVGLDSSKYNISSVKDQYFSAWVEVYNNLSDEDSEFKVVPIRNNYKIEVDDFSFILAIRPDYTSSGITDIFSGIGYTDLEIDKLITDHTSANIDIISSEDFLNTITSHSFLDDDIIEYRNNKAIPIFIAHTFSMNKDLEIDFNMIEEGIENSELSVIIYFMISDEPYDEIPQRELKFID
ncbi:MAG: hypothetical protein ACOCRO_10320 [Halanaerobiales bacterium]